MLRFVGRMLYRQRRRFDFGFIPVVASTVERALADVSRPPSWDLLSFPPSRWLSADDSCDEVGFNDRFEKAEGTGTGVFIVTGTGVSSRVATIEEGSGYEAPRQRKSRETHLVHRQG